MKKTIIIFGSISVVILLLFQLENWSYFRLGTNNNFYSVFSGILFVSLGVIVSRYLKIRSKQKIKKNNNSDLSEQEYRVLLLIAEGLSNKEIAEQLYIAESTVKSHVSSILLKLNAKRRTEAVKIGRELQII